MDGAGVEPATHSVSDYCSTYWAIHPWRCCFSLTGLDSCKCSLLVICESTHCLGASLFRHNQKQHLVDRVGFEPTTHSVSDYCSTKLSYLSIKSPSKRVVSNHRPVGSAVKHSRLLYQLSYFCSDSLHLKGFEPSTHRFRNDCSANWAIGASLLLTALQFGGDIWQGVLLLPCHKRSIPDPQITSNRTSKKV